MAELIEDYALVGDCQTAALVSRTGSIDWLCLPRFDSEACFAALVGNAEHGRWKIHPAQDVKEIRRRYRGNTLVLETEFRTSEGRATIIDFMPIRTDVPDLVRIVVGQEGRVEFDLECLIRPDTGQVVPWIRKSDQGVLSVAGPDAIRLRSNVPLELTQSRIHARFTVDAGESAWFVMTWFPSHEEVPGHKIDAFDALETTESWWEEWSGHNTYRGRFRDQVLRSAIILKALTYAPTGGLIAAPTTSLPETWGGCRNWDYRYCWLRDATFTLLALFKCGYGDEARAWRDWLVRAVAGQVEQIQPIYGICGERRLREFTADWLPGYEGARPVRIGNDACRQIQLDAIGEVMDVLHIARHHGIDPSDRAWDLQRELLEHLETAWQRPGHGIWEVRGPHQHFVHSKVMAWVAFDRGVRAIEEASFPGPLEHWREVRDTIHREVCQRGFNQQIGAFTQTFDGDSLDASLLAIPLVGFLPADDPRVRSTVDAIQKQLTQDGLVQRYDTTKGVDGLPGEEGTFLLCSFWLVDNLVLMGRQQEAEQLFGRLLDLCNDVGLLSEEYDPVRQRMMGNFPQAFSHVAIVTTASTFSRVEGAVEERADSH